MALANEKILTLDDFSQVQALLDYEQEERDKHIKQCHGNENPVQVASSTHERRHKKFLRAINPQASLQSSLEKARLAEASMKLKKLRTQYKRRRTLEVQVYLDNYRRQALVRAVLPEDEEMYYRQCISAAVEQRRVDVGLQEYIEIKRLQDLQNQIEEQLLLVDKKPSLEVKDETEGYDAYRTRQLETLLKYLFSQKVHKDSEIAGKSEQEQAEDMAEVWKLLSDQKVNQETPRSAFLAPDHDILLGTDTKSPKAEHKQPNEESSRNEKDEIKKPKEQVAFKKKKDEIKKTKEQVSFKEEKDEIKKLKEQVCTREKDEVKKTKEAYEHKKSKKADEVKKSKETENIKNPKEQESIKETKNFKHPKKSKKETEKAKHPTTKVTKEKKLEESTKEANDKKMHPIETEETKHSKESKKEANETKSSTKKADETKETNKTTKETDYDIKFPPLQDHVVPLQELIQRLASEPVLIGEQQTHFSDEPKPSGIWAKKPHVKSPTLPPLSTQREEKKATFLPQHIFTEAEPTPTLENMPNTPLGQEEDGEEDSQHFVDSVAAEQKNEVVPPDPKKTKMIEELESVSHQLQDADSELVKRWKEVLQGGKDGNQQLEFSKQQQGTLVLNASAAFNRQFLGSEDELVRVLLRLDAIDSLDDDAIRKQRKNLVKTCESMLDKLDAFKQSQWEKAIVK